MTVNKSIYIIHPIMAAIAGAGCPAGRPVPLPVIFGGDGTMKEQVKNRTEGSVETTKPNGGRFKRGDDRIVAGDMVSKGCGYAQA
jgi:hypothetical protein